MAKKGKDTSKFGQGCCSSAEEAAADKISAEKEARKEEENSNSCNTEIRTEVSFHLTFPTNDRELGSLHRAGQNA